MMDAPLRERLSRFLPADLLEQLPASQAMTLAIRRLNSLHQAIVSFLPRYIADNEDILIEDHVELRPGTFMFADVSGFTTLSEKLQREGGREGAEILTEVINEFFATMLEILAKSNGQLLKFAGDALLTFFPAQAGEQEAPLAIRTGLRMQRAMVDKFQPIQHDELTRIFGAHNIELTMSIGICQGQLFEALVGNNDQRDHIIQGDLPGEAMDAEAAGERDDVIVTADLQARYGDEFEMVPVGDGFFRVVDNFGDQLSDYEFVIPRRRRAQTSALFDFSEENLLEDAQRNLERVETIACFVSKDVVNKLAFKGDKIEAENRLATVIFVHFTGFAELLQEWGVDRLPLLLEILGRYYSLMQRTIASNGGSLNRTDPYQRGVKMLITFGAPVTYPDDPERAVTTALEMNRQLALFNARLQDELPDDLQRDVYLTQRVGITHGPVFAGEAGWKARREYTVMGDDVNLAARLMAKGDPGQILISQRVWERVQDHFETEELAPFHLKGKAKPTQAYLVKASTASALNMSATSTTPFIGRDLQLLSLTYALQQAKGPRRRQAFALHGEAGVGKTRMAKQVVEAAEQTGFKVAWANCQLRHSRDQSVWAAIIFQLLELEQAKSEQARRRLLQVRLSELDLDELEPVFSQLHFDSLAEPGETDVDADVEAGLPTSQQPPPIKTPAAGSTNIYEAAKDKTDLDKSGIFGLVRAELESTVEADDTSLWQSLQSQTSLPDGIVRFVQAFSDRTPTLLVIDDLHQVDPISLSILQRVLEEVTQARLMVLVTYEPTDDSEISDLPIRRKVALGDLDEDETIQMAGRVLGVQEIGPQLGDLLWQRSNGRPLFIESLLDLLREDEQLAFTNGQAELKPEADPDALPDNVRELITSRLDRLPGDLREILQIASVFGDGFSDAALLTVEGVNDADRLENQLDTLVDEEIIELQPDGMYRFRHGVTQGAVFETLNRLQRQKYHRAAADYWMAQAESDRYLDVVAFHLVKAGMATRAQELILTAAEAAEEDQRIDRAIALYTLALDIFPHDDSIRTQLERLQNQQL